MAKSTYSVEYSDGGRCAVITHDLSGYQGEIKSDRGIPQSEIDEMKDVLSIYDDPKRARGFWDK